MSQNTELLQRFYSAFQQRDWHTMAECYHPNASFKDPIFQLNGSDIGMMWRMLCERAQNFELDFQLKDIKEDHALVAWQANYIFSTTGRMVKNRIEASITFKDGLIYTHQDTFNFWRWSSQALGVSGLILGWTPVVKNKVSEQANAQLDKFKAKATNQA